MPNQSDNLPSVLALFGPTAIGKTDLAIAVTERLRQHGENPVAVSADALQVYRGLEILTGVASPAQQAKLEHRLISYIPLRQLYSVAEYARCAHAEIDGLLTAGRRPIVVGGTGLYLRAAVSELNLLPPPQPQRRAYWQEQLDSHGPQYLHVLLQRRDKMAAARVAPADSHRLIRMHELLDAGHPVRDRRSNSQLWTAETRHRTLLVGLTMEREALYERIDKRVDAMVAAGAVAEVQRAVQHGISVTARKALGFHELLSNDIDAMKRSTRQYARRQLTWMRKLAGVYTIDMSERSPNEIAEEIVNELLISETPNYDSS